MIGSWDNSDCVFALAPNAWSKGNGASDKNIGNMPSYPDGDYQNCVLTNMGTGYGYVYNSCDGYLRFDGVDDYIQTQYPVSISGATTNLTFEIKCNITIGVTRHLCGLEDDSNANLHCSVSSSGQLIIFMRAAGVTAQAISTDTISSGEHTFTFRIINGLLEIYIDGIEVSAYTLQQTITEIRTYTNKLRIGVKVASSFFTEKIYWFAVYEDAISETRILDNHNLNSSLGLKGNNTNDSMNLMNNTCCILRFRRQII